MKKSTIKIEVETNTEKMPVKIDWFSSDSEMTSSQPCKAMLLSLFDETTLETLKIDLWTKDLKVAEMDRFMFQTLRALCDTYYKSTNNTKLASEMQQFVRYFGEQTEIISK
jgi:gliding motility-associated protein GldC